MNVKRVLQKFEKPLLTLVGALGLTAILLNLDFSLLEANLYDFRMVRGIQKSADPDIVLVTLDDSTTHALDEFSPLSLEYHTQFMEALEKLEPRGVGYLVDLNRVNQANPELFNKEWGQRFVDSANRLQQHGTAVVLGTPYDVTGEVVPPFPLSSLPHSIAIIHKDGNVFAEDKITRRALLQLNGKPVFHLDFARRLGLGVTDRMPRGSYEVPEVEGNYFFFRYHGDPRLQADRSLPYKRIPFIDVLQNRVNPEDIRGKLVLVGTLSKEDSGDFAFTPYSKVSFTNPKLVVHANILDSLIHDDGIARAPNWINWLTTFTVTAIVITWVMNLTPLYGVFSTITLGLAFLVFGLHVFQRYGFWVRQSQPLVGIFVAYYLVVPYRLIREYKKRWDYQRKNEILTQVEELKRNFLSLVTHDLKTPVARIQGLAETILRKGADGIPDRERETLTHIIHSTEELNRFISSILELSKLESNELKIHLEQKDLNTLIERSVESFGPQARARRIAIETNLEPLFPIKLDTSLISKVINNLIDNALKYSPPDSKIRVESREVDNRVLFTIRDEGIGMTEEEKKSLFTRFYRAKNDTTTANPGTGLGLYLTKYFIEAHSGTVEVESEKGKGSLFTISLPVDAPSKNAEMPGLRSSLPNLVDTKEKLNV